MLLSITNNSIKNQSFVYTQINDQTVLFQQFSLACQKSGPMYWFVLLIIQLKLVVFYAQLNHQAVLFWSSSHRANSRRKKMRIASCVVYQRETRNWTRNRRHTGEEESIHSFPPCGVCLVRQRKERCERRVQKNIQNKAARTNLYINKYIKWNISKHYKCSTIVC